MARNFGLQPFRFSAPDHEPLPYVRPVRDAVAPQSRPSRFFATAAAWMIVAVVFAFGALSIVGVRPLAEGRSVAVSK